jgi:glycyl-tRNA synthetase beta chain
LFSIGEIPTGDKDPFALRRHALGVIRLLMENNLPFDLDQLIQQVIGIIHDDTILKSWSSNQQSTSVLQSRSVSAESYYQLQTFIYERLAGNLRDQGYTSQEVDAVLSLNPQRLSDISNRLAAVRAFAALPEAASLAAANKRVGNILKKAEGGVNTTVKADLLKESAEQALHHAVSNLLPRANDTFAAGDYTASLQILAALKAPVDDFFDHVMVNVDDASLRNNRLALLAQLHLTMNRVADISKLAVN